jgi:hypothetical protein
VGFYSEASVYGAATLAFASCLIFMRPGREFGGLLSWLDLIVGLGLELMTYLSTSSGALAGLGVMVVFQVWAMLANAMATRDLAERGGRRGNCWALWAWRWWWASTLSPSPRFWAGSI